MPAKMGGERLRDSNPPLPFLDLFFGLLDKANMVVALFVPSFAAAAVFVIVIYEYWLRR